MKRRTFFAAASAAVAGIAALVKGKKAEARCVAREAAPALPAIPPEKWAEFLVFTDLLVRKDDCYALSILSHHWLAIRCQCRQSDSVTWRCGTWLCYHNGDHSWPAAVVSIERGLPNVRILTAKETWCDKPLRGRLIFNRW